MRLQFIVYLATTTLLACDVEQEDAEVESPRDGGGGGTPCYQTECDGKDPFALGCDGDAETPGGARKDILERGTGYVLGYVEMRYSKLCEAQWGCVRNNSSITTSKVALRLPGEAPDGPAPFREEPYHCTSMRATPNAGYRVDGAIECADGCDSLGGYSHVTW